MTGAVATGESDVTAHGARGGARMVPFHCPYCGDEDLHPRPAEPRAEGEPSPGAAWECRSCARAFGLTYLGPAAGPLLPEDLKREDPQS